MYAIQGFVDPLRGPAVDMEDKPRMAKALAPLVRALQLADQLGGAGNPGGVDGEALDRLLGWKVEWEGGVDLDLGLGEVRGRQTGRQTGQAVEGRDGEAKADKKEKKEEEKKTKKKKKKKDAEKGKEAEGGRSGSDGGGGAGSAGGASSGGGAGGVGGAGDCAGGVDAAVNITGEEKGKEKENAASEAAAAIEKVAGKEDGGDGGGGGGGRPTAVEAVGSAVGAVAETAGAAAVVGTLIPTYQMVAIDGGAVTVTVELPLISGLKDMELDVSELALQLRVPIPGQEGGASNGAGGGGGGEASGAAEGAGHGRAYVLSLVLPVSIDANQVKAKFRRKKHHLVVTAPGKAVGGVL